MASDDRAQATIGALERLRIDTDQVFELRALNVPARHGRVCKPFTVTGWFDDLAELARVAVDLEDRGTAGIYVTLNPTKPALLARANNCTVDDPKVTTTDRDIVRRGWVPFDFDPIRASGISASVDEIKATRDRGIEAVKWINAEFGPERVLWAFSGSGFHALYRMDLSNDESGKATVRGIIEAVADRFTDDVMNVDRAVFNASRIWKLYGTVARKGDSVPKLHRTHRRACIVKEWFENGCPMNAEHGKGSYTAVIFGANGAVTFKCHHDGCIDFRWSDVRDKIDPDREQDDAPRTSQADRAVELAEGVDLSTRQAGTAVSRTHPST